MSIEIIGITVFVIVVFLLIQLAKMRGPEQNLPAKPADLSLVSNELPDISGEPLAGRRMGDSRMIGSDVEA